jgi:hypothetical protein
MLPKTLAALQILITSALTGKQEYMANLINQSI